MNTPSWEAVSSVRPSATSSLVVASRIRSADVRLRSRAEGSGARLSCLGVEGVVGVDAVLDGAQPGDGAGGETFLLGFVEADGQAVIVLVEADDGDEAAALEDAVGFGIAAAGEDFSGVHVAPQGQETIGKGQEAVFSDGPAGKPAGGWAAAGSEPSVWVTGRPGRRRRAPPG
nr:hypothetical protein [Streptomyces sp. S3(2020)]